MAGTTTPASWADSCRKDKWWSQRTEVLPAIEELQALLQGVKSSQEVAQTMASIFETVVLDDSRHTAIDIAQLWGLVCSAARQFGGDKLHAEQLADFMTTIQALPDMRDRFGNYVAGGSGQMNQFFWRDLPGFAMHVREYAIFECYEGFHPVFGEEWEEIEGDWFQLIQPAINATAFAATFLTRRGPRPARDYHAEVTLMSALEEQKSNVSESDLNIEAAFLLAAATWMLIASETIYGMCQARDVPDAIKARDSTNSLSWMGQGFFPARWKFWRERLQTLAEQTNIDSRCRDMAAQAARRMGEIDGTEKP